MSPRLIWRSRPWTRLPAPMRPHKWSEYRVDSSWLHATQSVAQQASGSWSDRGGLGRSRSGCSALRRLKGTLFGTARPPSRRTGGFKAASSGPARRHSPSLQAVPPMRRRAFRYRHSGLEAPSGHLSALRRHSETTHILHALPRGVAPVTFQRPGTQASLSAIVQQHGYSVALRRTRRAAHHEVHQQSEMYSPRGYIPQRNLASHHLLTFHLPRAEHRRPQTGSG